MTFDDYLLNGTCNQQDLLLDQHHRYPPERISPWRHLDSNLKMFEFQDIEIRRDVATGSVIACCCPWVPVALYDEQLGGHQGETKGRSARQGQRSLDGALTKLHSMGPSTGARRRNLGTRRRGNR